MGASTFVVERKGKLTEGERLFREAAEDDRHECGQGPYNGSIGQKSGFRVLNTNPLHPDEVQGYVDRNIDKSDKWDSTALALTIAAVTGKPRRRTFTVKAKSKAEAIEKAKARIKAKTPQHFKVIEAKATSTTHSNKVRRKKHGGKPKVQWAFTDRGQRYDTALEAAKAAEAYLLSRAKRVDSNEWSHMGGDEAFTVYPVVVLVGNDGTTTRYNKKPVAYTVAIGRNDQSATWEVELELREINPNEVGGWVFFGWKAE